jgi:hypothetical protein
MITRYQFLAQTKVSFAFLAALGFRVASEREGTYASFRDGFEIEYTCRDILVRVAYYDMELEILFTRGAIAASYYFIDQNLHANASGLAGCMFPFQNLPSVLDSVAQDIEAHYGPVLRGDPIVWQKIEKLLSIPRPAKPFLP